MHPENVVSVLAIGENFQKILFQTAISCAGDGLQVWVISSETINKIPPEIKVPDKEILQLITFMYLKDYNDLIKHFNGTHVWLKLPNVIIVSNFEEYCKFSSSDYDPFRAALASTSLLDSASVCSKKNNSKTFVLNFCDLGKSRSDATLHRLKIVSDLYFQNVIFDDILCKVLNLFGLS